MERYIEQLIQDIQERIKQAPPPIGMITCLDGMPEPIENVELSLEEAENFVSSPPGLLGSQLGFSINQFPSCNQLNTQQIEVLAKAMEQLWIAWHLVPDFPNNIPAKIKYNLMRDYFDKELVLVKAGEVHVEFCNYDPEECNFSDYCSRCKNEEEIFADNEKSFEN